MIEAKGGPERRAPIQPDEEPDAEEATAPPRRLLCAACSHPVTTDVARIERDGAHVHVKTNPANVTFELGCFGDAPGARAEGEATTFFTWFAGHAWRMAHCASCATHLGWRYDADGAGFWGLILQRLLREPIH